jgi:hypothetical protein
MCLATNTAIPNSVTRMSMNEISYLILIAQAQILIRLSYVRYRTDLYYA